MIMISIDDFIANIPDDELLTIKKENPTADVIFMAFIENPKLNAIKYTMKSRNIIIDPLTKKHYFEFSRYCADVITNIRCKDDTILLLNKQPMKCKIDKLTLPVVNMQYTSSRLELVSEHDITYDVYLLSDTLREQLRKKRVTNTEGMMFFAGGVYQYNK